MVTRILTFSFVLVLNVAMSAASSAQGSADGKPLNKKVPVTLGTDLGFGKKYRLSMGTNFQDWGVQVVTKENGHPVRLGTQSLRFETREGFCGWEPKIWNDCRKGRSRHELSTAVYGHDSWNREYWYAASVFVPKDYEVHHRMGNSMMQFLAGGKPNWLIKFDDLYGLFLQREFNYERRPITSAFKARDKWNDILIRITHSTKNRGRFTLWHNGRMKLDEKGQTSRKVPSKNKPYFKFGIYNTAFNDKGRPVDGRSNRDGKDMPNLVLYFDEIRSANSCESLKLGNLGYDCEKLNIPQ